MNSVTQNDPLGCGAACISFVAGINYTKTVSLLGKTKAKYKGYYCRDLTIALSQLGFSYTYKYLKPQLKSRVYRDGVIVFIKRSKRCPVGHYLVRYEGYWMDPWINSDKDSDIAQARSGFRKRLPGKPIYALFPQ